MFPMKFHITPKSIDRYHFAMAENARRAHLSRGKCGGTIGSEPGSPTPVRVFQETQCLLDLGVLGIEFLSFE